MLATLIPIAVFWIFLFLEWCSSILEAKRQDVVALSSTEAEFVSSSRAGQHAVSLRAPLFELGAPQHDPTIIYEDNLSCITASSNVQICCRKKHVNVRIYYIRDLILRDITQHNIGSTNARG